MKKVIVTGSHGFIGSALVNLLLKNDCVVVGLDCAEDNHKRIVDETGNYHFVNTLHDNWDTSEILDDADLLYHLGWGLSSYKNGMGYEACQTELQNVDFSCKISDSVVKHKVKKMVFVGSNYEQMLYWKDGNIISPKAIANIYGIAKHCACDMCRKICIDNGVEFNNVYLANTFGKGDYSQKAVNVFIQKLLKNEPLRLIYGNQVTDWMYVDDTVSGLYSVGMDGKNLSDYYIARYETKTFREMVEQLKVACQSDSPLLFGEFEENTIIDFDAFDRTKLYRETSFKLTDTLEVQMEKAVKWVKETFEI